MIQEYFLYQIYKNGLESIWGPGVENEKIFNIKREWSRSFAVSASARGAQTPSDMNSCRGTLGYQQAIPGYSYKAATSNACLIVHASRFPAFALSVPEF